MGTLHPQDLQDNTSRNNQDILQGTLQGALDNTATENDINSYYCSGWSPSSHVSPGHSLPRPPGRP